jgi:hypothetical protein
VSYLPVDSLIGLNTFRWALIFIRAMERIAVKRHLFN